MITGDQALIGRETAKQLGMGTNIFNTEVLLKVTSITCLRNIVWKYTVRLCFCGSA